MKYSHLQKILFFSVSCTILSIGLIATPASAASKSGRYLHWNCGESLQCGMVWGGMTGRFDEGTSAKCQTMLNAWSRQNTMQKFNGKAGAWCDSSSLRTEKSPH